MGGGRGREGEVGDEGVAVRKRRLTARISSVPFSTGEGSAGGI